VDHAFPISGDGEQPTAQAGPRDLHVVQIEASLTGQGEGDPLLLLRFGLLGLG
jgi:hypothetical protein